MDTDLKALAERIREAHQRASVQRAKAKRIQDIACQRSSRAREHAERCGELLIKAKNEFGRHGQWVPWLEANVPDLPIRTAQHYMRLARRDFTPPKNAKLAFLKFQDRALTKLKYADSRAGARAAGAIESLKFLADLGEDIDWDEAARRIETGTNLENIQLLHGRIRRVRDLLDELDHKLKRRVDVLEADRIVEDRDETREAA
jgi:hypothetical protein